MAWVCDSGQPPLGNDRKIEMRLFILYSLQLEIINFLCKNLRKVAS